MTGGRLSEGLYVPGRSPVHRLPPHVKLVCLLGFVLGVVATPRDQVWAFGLHAAALAGVVALARLRPALVLRRAVVEAPVVVFAVALPFVAAGERVALPLAPGWAVPVTVAGVLGAVNVLAKATLGVVAAVVLAATTRPTEIVAALSRLRVPATFVAILHFMIVYVEVVVADLRRMRIAREARGFRARHAGHVPVLARSAAALFVRAYERGERVHQAMIARGWTGVLPAATTAGPLAGDAPAAGPGAGAAAWARAAVLPLAAVAVAAASLAAGDATAWRPGA